MLVRIEEPDHMLTALRSTRAARPGAAFTFRMCNVPVAGDELQRPDRYLFLVHRLSPAWWPHGSTFRRMGHRVLRGQRLPYLPRSCAGGSLTDRRSGAQFPDPLDQRHRAYPQG